MFPDIQHILPSSKDATQEKRGKSIHPTLVPLKNESGAVLVLSIMILALMTCLGIAALNTTTIEYKIAGNEKVYRQAFYNADTGISYAVQAGIALFPPAAPGALTPLAAVPADLPANILLQYIDNGGSPRRVEIVSTGTAPGGGQSVIVAGIYGLTVGQQASLSNPLGY